MFIGAFVLMWIMGEMVWHFEGGEDRGKIIVWLLIFEGWLLVG